MNLRRTSCDLRKQGLFLRTQRRLSQGRTSRCAAILRRLSAAEGNAAAESLAETFETLFILFSVANRKKSETAISFFFF